MLVYLITENLSDAMSVRASLEAKQGIPENLLICDERSFYEAVYTAVCLQNEYRDLRILEWEGARLDMIDWKMKDICDETGSIFGPHQLRVPGACVYCGTILPKPDDPEHDCWIPYFYIKGLMRGPCCPICTSKYLTLDPTDGEWEIDPDKIRKLRD